MDDVGLLLRSQIKFYGLDIFTNEELRQEAQTLKAKSKDLEKQSLDNMLTERMVEMSDLFAKYVADAAEHLVGHVVVDEWLAKRGKAGK